MSNSKRILFLPQEHYVGPLPSPDKDIHYVVVRIDLSQTDVELKLLRFKTPNPERTVIHVVRSQSYTNAIENIHQAWLRDYPQFGQLEQDKV